jgi:uroporphyrinogen decarboxylase
MVPIDLGGHRSSGIAAIAYAKLKHALGISSGDIYVYDMVQQLAIVESEVLDAVGADVVEMGRGFIQDDSQWKPWTLPDGTPCKIPCFINIEKRGEDWFILSEDGIDLAVQKKGCLYFEQIFWPWLNRNIEEQDFSDLEEVFGQNMWTSIPAPGGNIPLTDEGLMDLSEGAKQLRKSTDRAIIGLFGGNLFEVPQFLYRMDNYLLHIAMQPDACIRLSEALCNFYIPRLEKWLGAVGPYIDIILFGDDLGGQNGPMISPQTYQVIYKPYHKKMWSHVKKIAPHIGIQLHSCGGIEPLLSDLIEAGLEMVNPVQITCRGMNPQELKEKYGDRLVFWGGGCDTRDILPKADPEEVKAHVKQQVNIFSPNGGFVFQQVHNILADVPPENVIAMYEAVRVN